MMCSAIHTWLTACRGLISHQGVSVKMDTVAMGQFVFPNDLNQRPEEQTAPTEESKINFYQF